MRQPIYSPIIRPKGKPKIIAIDVPVTIIPVSYTHLDVYKRQDLLYIINDLKRGGAEAISINEQRIISTSEIRCVGNTILVNTTRLAPPYHIKVIGLSLIHI